MDPYDTPPHRKAAERRIARLRDEPLDDARLHELIGLMLAGAVRRQVWLMFLDDAARLSDVVMPLSDYPRDPSEPGVVEDLGPVTAAALLSERIRTIAEAAGCGQAVLVWEREGGEAFRAEELSWASAMAKGLQGDAPRLRAQFVLHDDGLRVLAADDHAGAW
ncbi:hypothetical protein [Microbacterium marinilacus]|uniref:Histidine kinase n=1 Tax=Microbacterium marinilacus TaxID=415209 RepID=A0ABP7B610_9MICO|nr:hypothetical protein [Microbacterium marinilacus]MBY0687563.1 hypothetical protein [Microbacterium marinilacus]